MNKQLDVLIVEDEPLISIFIKRIVLKMEENILDICDNGEDAIEILKNQKPHLIFMDINLKGSIDGINVIKSVQMPYKPTIFFISAYGDTETIQEALSTNPYNYLVKPIKEKDIEVAVILARKQYALSNQPSKKDKQFLILRDNCKWDKLNYFLFYQDTKVTLTNYETLLLKKLIEIPNQTISYESLHNYIYDDAEYSFDAIRSLVKRLRKKIPKDLIKSSYKEGYKIELYSL